MTEQAASLETITTAAQIPPTEAPPPATPPADGTPPAEGTPPPAEAKPETPPEPAKPSVREELSVLAQAARARLNEARRLKAEREALRGKSSAADQALKENADLKALLDRAQKKPIDFLKERGVKPEEVLQEAVKAGTPEAMMAELRAENEAMRARLDEIVNQSKQSEEERIRQAQAAQAAQARQQAEHAFLTMIHTKADKYEALTHLYTPEEVKQQAYDVVRQAQIKAKEKGFSLPDLDDEEIADYLEQRARPRYDAVVKRAVDRRVTGTGTAGQGTAEAPRTLTNTMSTERSAQKLDPSTLSPSEQDAYWAAEYERLAGKGAPKP